MNTSDTWRPVAGGLQAEGLQDLNPAAEVTGKPKQAEKHCFGVCPTKIMAAIIAMLGTETWIISLRLSLMHQSHSQAGHCP